MREESFNIGEKKKQAGAELCQAQTQLGYDRPGFI